MQDFETMYNRYSKMVYTAAYQYLMNTAAAEDITQDVFVKLLTRRIAFNDEAHERAWLLRVTINLCKNYKKAKANNNIVFDETYSASSSESVDERLDIEREMLKLTPSQRCAVYLYYFEGYSVKETARIMGLPDGTVKSHLSRARKTIRINLGEE